MPNDVRWYLEGRIIYLQSSGVVSPPDLAAANEGILLRLNQSKEARVHLIIDDTRLEQHLFGVREVLEQMTIMRHAKLGWTLQFGYSNAVMKFIATVVSQFAKVRYRRMENLDEALAFLKTVDSQLQDATTSK